MAEKQKSLWLSGKKTYCLVTGASRGMGREIARQFSANFGKDSILLLVARGITALKNVKVEILAECPKVKVSLATYDLGKPDAGSFKKIIDDSLSENGTVPGDFQQVVVVHNAATLSNLRKAVDYGKYPAEVAQDLAVNVISPLCLNSVFLEVFALVEDKLIVDITSTCAFAPLAGMSLYSAGQAARNMYFNTMVTEEPSVRVIHYSPGTVDTEMYRETIELMKKTFPKTAQSFQSIIDNGQILTCETTIKKLVKTLQEGDFDFDKHVDYYDFDYYKNALYNTDI